MRRAILTAILTVIVCFTITDYVIPSIKYHRASQLRSAGQFNKAITTFAQVGNFRNASHQIAATYYEQGKTLREHGNWSGAVTAFIKASSYSDAATQIIETDYQHAKALMGQGSYDAAFAKFSSIKGYKDVDNLLASDHNLLVAAFEAAFQPGEYISFGHYPQTTAGNDKTPIEWLVLARDGRHVLLLSRYGLDAKPYNIQPTSITWEECTLRRWLNNDFLNKAFSTQEQGAILLTSVDNSKSQGYSKWSPNGGNSTQDEVFLLSYAEASKYFSVTDTDSNNTNARVEPTAYAVKQGAYTSSGYKTPDGNAVGWWWLRSPGYQQSRAAGVGIAGSLDYGYVPYVNASVRPALWVDIDLVAPFATYGK